MTTSTTTSSSSSNPTASSHVPALSARQCGNGVGVGGGAGGNATIAAAGSKASRNNSNSVGLMSSNKPNDGSQDHHEGAGGWLNDASEEGIASPEFAADNKRRRKRRPVTCARMLKRDVRLISAIFDHVDQHSKLKCDRGSPCGACRDRQEGHLCEWEGAVRLPNPAYTRDEEAQDLRHQLDRLEGLLNILGGTEGEPPRAKTEFAAARALGMLSLELAIGEFLFEVVPFLPLCHAPFFNARLRQFDDKNALEDPALLAVILGILGLYSHRLAIEDASRSDLASCRAFLNEAKTALKLANYIVSPTLDSLRAQLIIHHHEMSQDSPEATFLFDAVVRSAQHCDADSYRLFNCIELEGRRRIWHYIISIDWISNGGRTFTCGAHQYDTRFPANAFDVDITHDAVAQRPFGTVTPTLYISHLAQIASASRTITERVFAVHTPLPVTWHAIMQLSEDLDRIEATFPGSFLLEWKGEVVRPLDQQCSALDAIRTKVRLQLLRQHLRLNRPFLVRGCSDPRFKEGRAKCCWAAHQILSVFRGYDQHHKLSYSTDVTHHALNAILVLAVDLLQDPEGSGSDFSRRQLTSSIAFLEARQNHPVPIELQRECLRVASYLIRQASRGPERSRKRTSPGGFSRAAGSAHTSSLLAPILSGSTSMRGIEMPFTVPMPLTIALDPFGSRRAALMSPLNQNEMAVLWNDLRPWKGMYGLPDPREVDELVKIAMGGRAFSEGIDLLQP
ncbi:BQ2448_5632 [Microbotryum intermedium]|uniref:BQ2448_5632 protein n=1 Tax=Microbotryum intermedium TaxID=269621 RepID=A0A238F7B2_9BASI|nr:BQ2448_5632 [Microbotryum intermedium]